MHFAPGGKLSGSMSSERVPGHSRSDERVAGDDRLRLSIHSTLAVRRPVWRTSRSGAR